MTDKRFLDRFEENQALYPDKVIVRDKSSSLTNAEFYEQSGRVYAYLKARGIGREDVVMVALPRSVRIFVAIMGIWKAGAAMVCVEVESPENRTDFIVRDCNCKLVISESNWDEIISSPSLQGHEPTDLHDAAMVVYTSGSEGTPKGVMHEYGKLEIIGESCAVNGSNIFDETDTYGLWFPVSTILIGLISSASCLGVTMDIMPAEIRRNPVAMRDYIKAHHITLTGVIPAYLDALSDEELPLRSLQIGAEIASEVFTDKVKLINFYAQTESVAIVFTYLIDRKYDVTPIGRPTGWTKAYLLDDDDKPVAQNEIGELCYENPYTRGYINDPERTREAFRDGLFHTGDIARINEDGNYVILGRKTDMIKINGNRIEPAEIESAVKRVLGIDWAFVKGFVQPERSFICVYYTDEISIDLAATREALLRLLPNYMIPSYFIHVDEIPRLPNGKVNRAAFLAPDVNEYFTPYVAPTNELEQCLCEAMQRVLGVERVGINDDFFLLGGDSLRTIHLVAESNIEGLKVTDIYASRTPAKITEEWILKQITL